MGLQTVGHDCATSPYPNHYIRFYAINKDTRFRNVGYIWLQNFYSKFRQEKKCLVPKCPSWLPRKLILNEMDKKIV